MQIPIISRRGQNRPYGSIPRINRAHPLAANLKIYTYDAGGVIIDLVNGCVGSLVSLGGATVSNASSKIGGGIKFTSNGGLNDEYVVFPQNPAANTFSAANPNYTEIVGTFYTAAPSLAPFNINVVVGICGQNNNGATGGAQFVNTPNGASQNTLAVIWANGATISTYNQTIAQNTFQTWGTIATGATTATFYANGNFEQNLTGIGSTVYDLVANGFGGGQLYYAQGGGVSSGIAGFVPFFACWDRRLSAAEMLQVHNDPYCFLIYPEDEMFAMLVGVTITPPASVLSFGATMPMMGIG